MAINFLIIGEICKDKFVYGKITRLSPEAPVPVFVPTNTVVNDGMAGNVMNNLLAIIKENKTNHSVYSIFPDSNCEKTRYVDHKTNHYFLRVDENDIFQGIEFTEANINKIKNADCIIVSDYDKGFIKDDDLVKIKSFTKDDAEIFIDTKKKISIPLLELVSYVKINENEFRENLPTSYWTLFYHKIIVTLGERGAHYLDILFKQENPRTTYDVSGAGDTFTAALAYHYMINKSIPDAIRFANNMASIVVSKKGVSTI